MSGQTEREEAKAAIRSHPSSQWKADPSRMRRRLDEEPETAKQASNASVVALLRC